MHKIAFRLGGLDLREPTSLLAIPEHLAELSFEANGQVSTAVLYMDSPNPLDDAKGWGRDLIAALPEVDVEMYDELVSTSDIAARCDVSAESVRLWAAGKRRKSARPFPRVRDTVGADSGGKMTNLYLWREVLAWVREVLRIDPDEDISYLGKTALRELDAYLDELNEQRHVGYHMLTTSTMGTITRDVVALVGAGSFGKRTAVPPLVDYDLVLTRTRRPTGVRPDEVFPGIEVVQEPGPSTAHRERVFA